MRKIINVSSVQEMWRTAAEFAVLLKPGVVVALHGDLGSGKTTFMQGVAAALGVRRPVTSPTFTIANEYQTDAFTLVHMDLYRLGGADDLDAIGFNEHLENGAVVALEWPERAPGVVPSDAWHIHFAPGSIDHERVVRITAGDGMV